jgi:hypothetical protein
VLTNTAEYGNETVPVLTNTAKYGNKTVPVLINFSQMEKSYMWFHGRNHLQELLRLIRIEKKENDFDSNRSGEGLRDYTGASFCFPGDPDRADGGRTGRDRHYGPFV